MMRMELIAAAFCIATMAGARGAEQTVKNPKLGFEISCPDTWTVKEKPVPVLPSLAAVLETTATKVKAIVSVYVDPCSESRTLKKSAEIRLADQKEGATTLKVREKKEIKLANTDALKLTYDYEIKDNVGRYVDYILIKDKLCYVIATYAAKDDYDKCAKEIEAVVKSLKLTELKKENEEKE